VAGGLGQEFVAHHALLAFAIGVAYEAVVAIGGFFAVIARDVSSRWQARLADRIDLFLQRKGPRFERRYRQFVLDGLRFTDTKGLATVGPFTPEHDAVFVDVSLVPRPPQQIKPGILPEPADDRARHSLGYFLGRAEPVVLAVVGGPGSGKTTLLRHAARQACMLKRSQNQARDIPVLLYLRDHAAAIAAEPAVSVAALLRSTLGAAGADEPPEWFEEQLEDGRCLVLLDGLDEVARQVDRAKISAWTEAQVRQYPGSSFVISSRPQGYQSAPVEGAEIVQVCGFTAGQVAAFVRGWYQAAEQHGTGTAGPEVEARSVEGAADLLERLDQAPALCDLTVNPLLLTMIANVHRYRGALPGSRADLYAEICQVMLWRRQEAKRLIQQVSGDKKESILRGLAYAMMERRVADLSRDDVLAEIQPALRRVSRSVTSDDFIADVSSNGLLIERETGQYAFAHKTFQEYLAATHIRERGLASVLVDAVNDDWWAEATLHYAAKSNADRIVRACLDANSAPALALALDCVDQDSDVDPDLRERVNAVVLSAAELDADPERRHLFSGILLRKHVRQRVRTTAGTQITLRPIPMEIYRLFLADTMTPEPDAPPAVPGIAVGMRGSDAAAFILWAIDVSSGQQGYRLPLAAEVNELATRHRIPALPSGRAPRIWIQADGTSEGTPPALWVPPGEPAFAEFESASLAKPVERDVTSSAFTLNRLLLLRSRVLVRVLVLVLDRTRDLDFARDPLLAANRALDRDVGLALDLARALAHDLDRDVALDIALDRARPLDRSLERALTRALDRDVALYLALDLARARALARALATDGARARSLGGARTHARDLDFALALDLDVRLDYLRVAIQSLLDGVYGSVLGRAFSAPFTETTDSISREKAWDAQFAAAFINAAGIKAGEHLSADLTTLEETLREAVTQLAFALNDEKPFGPTDEVSWPSTVAKRLQQNAMPVFGRTERVTPEKAISIRMAALCLAGEADWTGRTDIGDKFRRVAVGVTVLEQRATDERWSPEVIILAVD
jgi:hypothetical protein